MNRIPNIELNNGLEIPMIGFGTFKIGNDEAKELVLKAFEAGYRHIDTAFYYKNEKGIGEAIRESGLARKDIVLASKIWLDDLGYDKTMAAFEASMKNLGLDYIDLMLIHWPRPAALESWQALEEQYADGRVKAIGVCNYKPAHLEELLASADIKPVLNQVECHPRLQQKETIDYCRSHGIAVEAWSPIMKGQVMDIPLLQEIGARHGKSPAQVSLRWHLQRGVVIIPKSSSMERMKQNLDILDFELSDEDMKAIKTLDEGVRLGFDPDYIYENGFDPARDLPKK